MRRNEIRFYVDTALAMNGYSRGWYAWQGCTLRVSAIGTVTPFAEFRLPSGISAKRLMAALSTLPVAGKARKAPAPAPAPAPRQLCMVRYIEEQRVAA